MAINDPTKVAEELYTALAAGDRDRLATVLHPQFHGTTTEGLPLGLGGEHEGPDAMRREVWGRIAKHFDARAEPSEYRQLDDGRLLVIGQYVGTGRATGRPLDAAFTHLLTISDGCVRALTQLTDSHRWHEALHSVSETPAYPTKLSTVRLEVADGVAELRLNRPDARGGINPEMADDLYEAAQRCATTPDVRAVLITGTGPAFTVGGDVHSFGHSGTGLPALLRRMTGSYHEALRILDSLDAPVVAAVHGAVAGGGLGLLCVADVALAAEGTKFATGFADLGLSGDGGASWFLPRLLGPRTTAEMYFEGRVLDAHEAADSGLLTRVVAADEVTEAGRVTARSLADGPTAAFAEIRRLLRQSNTATLSEQLHTETEALARTAASQDAGQAMASFLANRPPTFRGH